MKIGVNARFLTKPYTGIGQYTDFLFRKMELEFLMIVPEKVPYDGVYILPEIEIGSAGMRKTYWEQIQVPQFLKKERVDLVHFPYPCNPWYPFNVPTVVTIHDTIPWDMPEYRSNVLSKLYHAQTQNAARRASKIITVSEASKKDIVRHLNVPSDRVRVIYNAASPVYSHSVPSDHQNKILAKYGLNRPYFLYVGGYDKRKNVNFLLKIFNKYIAPDHGIDLVLIGGKLHESALYEDFDFLTKNCKNTKMMARKGDVKHLGFLLDEELAAIYQGSLSFLHFSKKEGFNIPIVEAFESGIPVILSDTEVHREIAKEGAEYVDLLDEAGCAKTLSKVVSDKGYRDKLASKARKMKGKYTWEEAAKETMAVYKSLL